jgi:NhaP-type Na+/H+ or K+/H+ antiporter
VALARLRGMLRRAPYRHDLMDDFLGLGLIGVVYGTAVLAHAWGFLAVFFAAVALRQTELKQARAVPLQESGAVAPAADAAGSHPPADRPAAPMVSIGSLVFKEHLERLSELVLVLLVGGALFLDSWSWQAVAMAGFLFAVARPLSVLLVLRRASMPLRTQGMIGWFGVRGIGSLYYLMFAIQHGLPEALALQLIQMTLIVVTLSILLHGISVKPLMAAVWRRT